MKPTPKQARRIRRTIAAFHEVLSPVADRLAESAAAAGASPEYVARVRAVAAEQVARSLAVIDRLQPLADGAEVQPESEPEPPAENTPK